VHREFPGAGRRSFACVATGRVALESALARPTRCFTREESSLPYLKQAIRNFLVDERRRAARSVTPDVWPDAVAGGWNDLVDESSGAPDEARLRAWAQSLVAMAVARLETDCRAHGQAQHFQLFARRYLTDRDQPPAWREVGEAFGLDEKTARSRAETAARHFRALLRQLVASDIGSEQAIDDELHAMIAVL